MLPHSDDRPSEILEAAVGSVVSLHVALELLLPPLGIGLGEGGVVRAAMPEAAIYEDGDPLTGKGDVGAGSTELGDVGVDSIAQPPPVQLPSDRHFGFGPSVADLAHTFRHGGGGGDHFGHRVTVPVTSTRFSAVLVALAR